MIDKIFELLSEQGFTCKDKEKTFDELGMDSLDRVEFTIYVEDQLNLPEIPDFPGNTTIAQFIEGLK